MKALKKEARFILILGDQLDLQSAALQDFDRKTDEIIMVESSNEAQYVWTHKAKIVLFLSAMRHFAQTLKEQNYPLTYIQESPLTIFEAVKQEILRKKVRHLVCVEPGEWRVRKALEALALELNIQLEIRDDTHFYCTPQEFKAWVADKKELRLEYFYRLMRKTNQVLVDGDGNPEGGQWNFDQDNRKPYPKKGPGLIDAPASFAVDVITQQVLDYVELTYPNHPGSLAHFNWPVTREQALEALEYFVEYRLRNFGVYQDAMWTDTPFGWHSILSSALNLKLLNPREVIASVLKAWKKYSLELSSIEGFIRQILGWREFVRGMYYLDMPQMALDNFYEHQRALPKWYWTGQTEMACMKDTIGQTMEYGYAHHI